jgi:hypothetical protein
VYPEILTWRYYFVPVYVMIWVAILWSIAMAFVQPHAGLL